MKTKTLARKWNAPWLNVNSMKKGTAKKTENNWQKEWASNLPRHLLDALSYRKRLSLPRHDFKDHSWWKKITDSGFLSLTIMRHSFLMRQQWSLLNFNFLSLKCEQPYWWDNEYGCDLFLFAMIILFFFPNIFFSRIWCFGVTSLLYISEITV